MKQITIVSEDRPGVVHKISEVLAEANVNIETIDAESVGGSVVTILTVDRYDDALRALIRTPYHAISEDALVVQLDDKPGELARITRPLKDAGINMRSMRIIRRHAGKGIMAIACERPDEARQLLKDVLIS